MKNKGFTTIELIVSFSLVTIITILLFQLVFVLKDLYVYSGMRIKLLTKAAKINIPINDDIANKILMSGRKISDTEIELCFSDSTCKSFSFDPTEKTITYGDLTQKLVEGSEFGNIIIKTETFISTYDTKTLNSMLTIKLPIYTSLIKGEDFGVNIVYLYNSNVKSLSGLNVSNISNSQGELVLIGNDHDSAYKGVSYTDPGYQPVNSDCYVNVSSSVDTSKVGNYYITYTLYDQFKNILDQKVRVVSVYDSEYNFSYQNSYQEWEVPTDGKYLIKLWGASGGGNATMSGKGGYTEGYFNLTAGETLYIYTGGKGLLSTNNTKAVGGFNGGGDSGSSSNANFAGSGGGATDIRKGGTALSNRILVAGGGGGAGSVNDSIYYCYGGQGGGENGTTCSKCDIYSGSYGTQSAGGAKSTYTSNLTLTPTDGSVGVGGRGASYSLDGTKYSAGGGGGGYYGGGGGARYGSGGGGSGYCGSAMSCITLDGTNLFTKPNSTTYEKGHSGNGYVSIQLVSTIIDS